MEDEYKYASKNQLFKLLKSSTSGLSKDEASKRTQEYGLNELPKEEKFSLFQIFVSSLKDPIIYVLLVSSILSLFVKEYIDSLAIIIIILVDAIVSTIQEYSANKNSEALRSLIRVNVKVIRGNRYYEIDSSELVPGDIVVIEPGTKVSADMRLITADNVTVDESVLTGESFAVIKDDIVNKKNIDNDTCVLFGGTSVLTGHGIAVVIRTGINSEIGKIAKKVTDTEASKSPLTIRMEKFSKQITFIIIAIAFIIGLILVYKENALFDIFICVVALSVSAMPEGLPLAVTMALTIGSNRMGKRNVIVKKLNSVESLGSCTVIASDKTGTLTVNEQTAKRIVLANGNIYDITGDGYDVNGKIIPLNKGKINDAMYISKLGYINNDSIFEKNDDGKWKHIGDSIDVAFKVLANKLKVTNDKYKVINSIPYESEKKYSALFYLENNEIRCTAKGSIEKILEFCSFSYENGKKVKIDKNYILNQNEELAKKGYKVIAICDSKMNNNCKCLENSIKGMTFVGLIAFIDPVRKEIYNSIKECKLAGIKVIMITGDHALTAYSIGKDIKMVDDYNEVTTGEQLEKYLLDESVFDNYIKDKKIFARVTPIQKLQIIESFERNGEFVAVTGDGVNDAPAIKVANIGVAMGSGTDVAKETANMIVIDDNFSSIVAGIEEGRNAYSNIRKISIFLLSSGLAEVLFFILSIIFNMPIPLLAIQLLWLNLVTDGLQDMALSFEQESDTLMKEKPRNPNEGLFEKELSKQIIISGLSMGILVFIVWIFLIKVINMDVSIARGYVLALMVFIQNFHAINCRSEKKSIFVNKISKNKFIAVAIVGSVLLQIIVMEVPILSNFLQTTSIPYLHLILLIIIASLILFVMELYKYIKRVNR